MGIGTKGPLIHKFFCMCDNADKVDNGRCKSVSALEDGCAYGGWECFCNTIFGAICLDREQIDGRPLEKGRKGGRVNNLPGKNRKR
jgi:hypothetical protein